MRALISSCRTNENPAEIVRVVSNNPDAAGISAALDSGIKTEIVDHRRFADGESFESELGNTLESAGTELICLAGFMRLLSPDFVNHWRDRLINIHPSLLPAFKGLDTHRRVIESGVRITGCTVHFVRPKMDDGPIIIQAAISVHPDDTNERLAERVLHLEHRCYPLAVRWIAEGRVKVIDERAIIANADITKTCLVNPET